VTVAMPGQLKHPIYHTHHKGSWSIRGYTLCARGLHGDKCGNWGVGGGPIRL